MMAFLSNNKQFRVWTLGISSIIALAVVLLSLLNEVRISELILRAGVSFGLMFLVLTGILSLFEKTAFSEPQPEDQSQVPEPGGLIDFSVGEPSFPGQVDKELSAGLPDSKKQAEIVRRMGWG